MRSLSARPRNYTRQRRSHAPPPPYPIHETLCFKNIASINKSGAVKKTGTCVCGDTTRYHHELNFRCCCCCCTHTRDKQVKKVALGRKGHRPKSRPRLLWRNAGADLLPRNTNAIYPKNAIIPLNTKRTRRVWRS